MEKRITLLAMGLCLSLFSVTATAVLIDTDQEPDWRDQPGSTFQQWNFDDEVAPEQEIGPDAGWVNENDSALLTYYPGSTSGWENDKYDGHQGVLPLSGSIKIGIPNFPDQNPYKDILVQLIWAPETPRGKPLVEVIPGDDAFADDVLMPDGTQTLSLDGDWNYSQYSFRIYPNPAFEYIWISGSILVDSVIVDTICVPEPLSISLLGLGALLIRHKRRGTAQ